MQAEGRIVEVNGSNAVVSVIRRSACAGCSGSCEGCGNATEHLITVKNTVSAEVGDTVYIKSKSLLVFALCLVLFIVPLVAAATVYSLFWGGNDSFVGSLTALLVAFAAFALLYLTVGKSILRRNEYKLIKKFDEWKN